MESATIQRERGLAEEVTRRWRARQEGEKARVRWGRAALIAILLGLWFLAAGRLVPRAYVSDPLEVLVTTVGLITSGRVWPHLLVTVVEVAIGYAIGATIGVVVAVFVGVFRSAERVLQPFIIAFYGIPKIALAPLIVMWFGLGLAPKVVLAAGFVFFIVFMNTIAGIRSVSPNLRDVARVMGASPLAILWKITLPSAVPYMMTGLRLAIPEALIGAVIGELFAATTGLGYMVDQATAQSNMAVALAALVFLLVIVIVFDFILGHLEDRLLVWRPEGLETRAVGG